MNNNYINLIAIDPGNNIGVSIYTIDLLTFSIVNITTRLYILENFVNEDNNNAKLLMKLNIISSIVNELCIVFKPSAFAIETAFLNMRFPKAAIQLSQYVGVIEHTVSTYNKFIKMFRYMPKYVKKYVNAGGDAGKDDMTIALNNIPEITQFIQPELLSEHEVDATSIGYVMLEELRRYPFLLYTL